MKTIKQVRLCTEFVHFIPDDEHLQEQTLYVSEEYKVGAHLCLCGCKNLVVTPFTEGGWKLNVDDKNKISISPSIGNYNFPCKSHYIITKSVANFV